MMGRTTISQEWCPVYPTSHTLQERNPSPALLQIFCPPFVSLERNIPLQWLK